MYKYCKAVWRKYFAGPVLECLGPGARVTLKGPGEASGEWRTAADVPLLSPVELTLMVWNPGLPPLSHATSLKLVLDDILMRDTLVFFLS